MVNNNEYKLINTIISLSLANEWETAKDEWEFTNAFVREGSECLCGKKDIKNVCVITNELNKNVTEVGNCCVKKFLDIKEGDKIFTAISKLKKNNKSSITHSFLRYIYREIKLIDADEYELYNKFFDYSSKKDSTEWNQKIEINQKIINHYLHI